MSDSAALVHVNTKILNYPTTGTQRYLMEILQRLPIGTVAEVKPSPWWNGGKGHLWEQLVLPWRVPRAGLLWSPSNNGPLSRARQVVTIHDMAPIDHPEWFAPTFARLYRFLVPRLARRVRHILTVSSFSKERIVSICGVPPEKVTVTPLAADARFSPAAADPARVASLRLPTRRYILALGSIEPRKNVPALLRAWESVLDRVPEDVGLVLAGGMGRSSIFAAVDIAFLPPRVHLAGHVADENLPALIAGAMGFCYPSVYEGFGLPPLEAMACGVPVLTGATTALPEVVGGAGLLVDATSIEALADGILRLATDGTLRDDLRRRGLERSRAFAWDTTAARTWDALQAAAAS